MATYVECPRCGGDDPVCPVCEGQGLVDENGRPPEIIKEGDRGTITKVHEDELDR